MQARAFPPLALLLMPACSSEPSFEDRYNAQSANMSAAAGRMEAELHSQLNAAQAAGAAGNGSLANELVSP